MTAVGSAHVVQGRTESIAVHPKFRGPGGTDSPSTGGGQKPKQKEDVLQGIGENWQAGDSDLHIEVNRRTGDVVFQIISKEDGKVVREIHCKSAMPGLLVNRSA